jgi:hypothetical protein
MTPDLDSHYPPGNIQIFIKYKVCMKDTGALVQVKHQTLFTAITITITFQAVISTPNELQQVELL